MTRKPFFLWAFLWAAAVSMCLLTALPAAAETPQKTVNGLFPDEIISAEGLHDMIVSGQKILLLDARSKRSFDESHIQGAVLPLKDAYYQQEDLFKNGIIPSAPDYEKALKEAAADYPADVPIVTYCNTGCHAGAVLALRLKQFGVKGVRAMDEGFQTWESKGYPTTRS